jgi:hypothetical protein
VYYLRRHVVEMFDEAQLEAFLARYPDGVFVMPAGEYEAIRARLPVATRVIAGAQRFDARLGELLSSKPLPRLVLVTATDAK